MKSKYNLAAVLSVLVFIASVSQSFGFGVNVDKEKQSFGKATQAEQKNIAFRLSREGKTGAHALMYLIENTKDTSARGRAFAGLRQSMENPKNQDDEIFSKLEKMANDTDMYNGFLAAKTLMNFKSKPRARNAIKHAIRMQKGELDRGELLGVLMVNTDRDKSELSYLRDFFLHDESEHVKLLAAGYMGRLGDRSGVALCKEILEREPLDGKVQMLQRQAAIAAGIIGDPQLLPTLKQVSNGDKYGIARPQAFSAVLYIELGMQQNKTAKLAYLKQALTNRHSGRWAVNILRNMKDKDADALLEWGYSQPAIARNMR